jgi:hypothetical protein
VKGCHSSGCYSLAFHSSGMGLINSSPVNVGFALEKVALGQVFLSVFRFCAVSVILPIPHTHSFTYHQHCIISAVDSILT